MGTTKTDDEAGTTAATEVKPDEETVDATAAEKTPEEATAEADLVESDRASEEEDPSGVGLGAGAVVSAGLGIVSLTGSWIGTVAAARQTLVGQLGTSQSATVAKQVKAVYGDAWQTSALWGGLFALLALVVGVVVLARPAFGAPGKAQPVWIKSVAWGGVALGVIGLLLAVLKYTDILLGLPSAG